MLYESYAIPGLRNVAFTVRNGIACIAPPTVRHLEQFCMHRYYCMQAVVSIIQNSKVVCYAYSSVHYLVDVLLGVSINRVHCTKHKSLSQNRKMHLQTIINLKYDFNNIMGNGP